MHRRLSFPLIQGLAFSQHSFRLLLYLEWMLLGITLLLQLRPSRHSFETAPLFLSVPILIGFGLMGLRLPSRPTWLKVLYTGLEFVLLYLTFRLDPRTGFFPLLGLVIVIRSCLIFAQPGRLLVSGLVYLVFLLIQFLGLPAPRPRPGPMAESVASIILTLKLTTAITFGLTLWFILLLVNALLSERQSREKLLLAYDQLRQYALRIEDQATLQERNRIAREIHDALGHTLTAQSIQLENALLFLPAEAQKSASFLQEARQLGSRALQEVRRSIATLRSNPLQGQSLETAIATAITQLEQTTGIQPQCKITLADPLPTEISTALYRIIQEALTNIYKHSGATAMGLELKTDRHQVQLQIQDNGQGFDPEGNTTGFGLQGMRERTLALGGDFQLFSQPGQGCQLLISMPLPKLAL